MPEGDTIFRAARTLHLAIAGRAVTRFESVYPQLTRIDHTHPLSGRTIERVEARGKHLLIWFTGDLVLRTHMRMHGSWHLYRPGERWKRPGHEMRIVIETDAFHAVAFTVPVAEFLTAADLARMQAAAVTGEAPSPAAASPLARLGPDPLASGFDEQAAVARLRARAHMEIADALLDQSAIAGIGNVYKSETLFIGRVNPFTPVPQVSDQQLHSLASTAARLMRANVQSDTPAIVTYTGLRRTTGRADPSARLWVYGRAGKPCRRCGTPISRRRQGPHARSTYWCPRCQPTVTRDSAATARADGDPDTSVPAGTPPRAAARDDG